MLLSTCRVHASVLTAALSAVTQQHKALHCKSQISVFLLTMQGAQWLAELQCWHQQDLPGGVLHQGAAACCLCNLLCHVWLGFCHCSSHWRLPQVCRYAKLLHLIINILQLRLSPDAALPCRVELCIDIYMQQQ